MEKVLLCTIAASALCATSTIRYRQYHFIYDPKNWTDAQTYCRQTYTDLVTVDSYSMVTTLNNLADVTQMGPNKDAWIGLYFDVCWQWSLSDKDFCKNNEATFMNWYSGQPDSIWYLEECAYMEVVQGRWRGYTCSGRLYSVCSNVSGGNVIFFVNKNLMNWTDAQSYCRQHYTDLASVRTMSENSQIWSLLTDSTWIGLYRNTWKWSNGSILMYNYWQSGLPTGGNENCTAANFGNYGRWVDWTCGVEKPFICYHDPVPLWRTTIKVKLVKPSTLDMEDPAVQEDLLQQLTQKLMNQNMTGDIKLSWKKQPNGDIFYREKKGKQ